MFANPVGNTSLYLIYPVGPSVTMSSTANPSLLEQSLRLTCVDSQGIPPPEFTWQKCVGSRDTNCRSLPNEDDNGDVLSPSSNTSVLTIESVGLDDGAYYKCEGRNAYGNIIAFQNIPVAGESLLYDSECKSLQS